MLKANIFSIIMAVLAIFALVWGVSMIFVPAGVILAGIILSGLSILWFDRDGGKK